MAAKVVILLGPTAVGKTAYSIDLARQYGSPVINCDSRQLYKELNIGVARPSTEELAAVKHYFIASHSIEQPISAGEYELQAWKLVKSLSSDHSTLLMVGGSGLYIDAFCNGMDEFPPTDPQLRVQLTKEIHEPGGLERLRAQLKLLDSETYAQIDLSNWQRVLRALEVCLLSGRPYSSFKSNSAKQRPLQMVKIGLTRPRAVLNERINRRVDQMMEEGLLEEARQLYLYKDTPALQTVGYRELFAYFDGQISLDTAVEQIKSHTRQYAKRQMSYWHRDASIEWKELAE